MSLYTPKPTVHIFKEINQGKFKCTKHYNLVEVRNGKSLVSSMVNISKNRNFAKSCPEYWLKIRDNNKWSKNITGLFKTKSKLTYHGDINFKQDLIIFRFSSGGTHLVIFYFKNYYTKNINDVIKKIYPIDLSKIKIK